MKLSLGKKAQGLEIEVWGLKCSEAQGRGCRTSLGFVFLEEMVEHLVFLGKNTQRFVFWCLGFRFRSQRAEFPTR